LRAVHAFPDTTTVILEDTSMLRKAFCLGLVGLTLCAMPISADTGGPARATRTMASSSTKRVVWTLVGIGAGFGAGLFIGLNAFDDAVNSDRKVWTSAIVGAAAGGLAGGLLSRNVGRVPQVRTSATNVQKAPVPRAPWTSMGLSKSADDEALRRRVRAIGAGAELPPEGGSHMR
jgi:hypothetical protein